MNSNVSTIHRKKMICLLIIILHFSLITIHWRSAVQYVHDVLQLFLIVELEGNLTLAFGRITHLNLRLEELSQTVLENVEFLRQLCLRGYLATCRLDVVATFQGLNQFLNLADGQLLLLYLTEQLDLQ